MSDAQQRRDEDKANGGAEATGFASGVASIPLPRVFGRLLLLKLLARGGMGDVYLAATTGIEGAERPIVVKTVRRDHIHDGSFLARFLDEARVQSQLNHPGVAQILEASTDENGEPYTVVEYVEGRSLADVRHRAVQIGARLGWPEAVAMTIEMGQALAHVHERSGADGSPLGIVHRDLSPQNVMIGYAGDLKLIDFGTARGHNRRCHTVAGVVFAKPGYVAPEVARQQVGDGRIDVYAMGVMLWELCAGKRLLQGDAQKHLEEVAAGKFEIPRLAGVRGTPAELDDVIAKLCANDPDDRYASAAHASSDLAKILSQAPVGKNGERSVRGRIGSLMKTLWPHEPARSRAEFAKLLRQARELRQPDGATPVSGVMTAAADRMNQDPDILAGTSYRLVRKIGEGSSGEVYEAEHVELGRRYAVKVLSAAHTAAHDAVERFRREARAIANLSHPNLVRLHDFGKSQDGRVFLAMELLSGKTLDQHAEKGLPWRESVRLAVQVTHALEAAHVAGLVHRDLKPQNLFLTDAGELKLLDFGVAMALTETSGEERRQKGFAIFGTPEYMAPEQVAGETVDARSDLYALGCVLYELVTGSRPFEGSPVVVMGKQLREDPERPSRRAPTAQFPRELEAVVMKALAKEQDARFASASAMRDALLAALAAPARRQARGRTLLGLTLGASLALLGAAELKGRVDVTRYASLVADRASAVAHAIRDTGSSATPSDAWEVPEPVAAAEPAPAVMPAPVAMPAPAPEPVAAPAPAPARVIAASHTPAPVVTPATSTPRHERAATAMLVKAGTRERSGDAAKGALDGAREIARIDASNRDALKTWATAALAAGELREARRAAESWAVHDASVEPRLFLSATLEASGRHREARAVLDEWLANHPDSVEAKRMLNRLGGSNDPAIKRTPRSRARSSSSPAPTASVDD